jgi:hypothetical protein
LSGALERRKRDYLCKIAGELNTPRRYRRLVSNFRRPKSCGDIDAGLPIGGPAGAGGFPGIGRAQLTFRAHRLKSWGTRVGWAPDIVRLTLRVPVERDHGFRRKMIIQSSGT